MWETDAARQQRYWADGRRLRAHDHPVVRSFARQRLEYLGSRLDLRDVRTALDVGCGNGASTFYLQELIPSVWAVDRSEPMLAHHPLRSAGRVAAADALRLPFRDGAFDLVLGWEVLHHLPDPRLAVAEMARVSRRYVVLAEPNRDNPVQFAFSLLDREHRWVLRYSLSYLTGLCKAAGLTVTHAGRGGWIFPNVTPSPLCSLLQALPYRSPLGISNWVVAGRSV